MPIYRRPWTGQVILAVKQYNQIKARTDGREAEIVAAVDEALKDCEKHKHTGKARKQAAIMVYINQTHRSIGAAQELNYSVQSVRLWNQEFITNCARHMGYKM